MTFMTEMCSTCDPHTEKTCGTIGQALEKCLSRALAAQRVTVGVQECAKLLGCAPERVMLCLIPDMAASPDVGVHIQQTLVRSFCWENDIRLLTIKDNDKLRHIFDSSSRSSSDANAPSSTTTDTININNNNNMVGGGVGSNPEAEGQSPTCAATAISCMLIEMPTEDPSPDEEFLCNYHDTVIYSDIFPKPVIQLPV